MSTPMSVAARLLARLLNPAPAAAVAASVVTLSPAIVIEAQASQEWEYSGFHGSMGLFSYTPYPEPSITTRDLRLFSEALRLDDLQREIMADAYEEFVKSYNREWTLHSERRSDAQSSSRHGLHHLEVQEQQSRMEAEFDRTVRGVEDAFASDIRLLLVGQQLDRWPDFERERRRLKTLEAYAADREEGIDLITSVFALDIDDESMAALRPVLDEYRVQIDGVLVARNAKAEALGETLQQLQLEQAEARMNPGPMGMGETWMEIQERQQQLVPEILELHRSCARVRDMNVRFRARIEDLLPSDSKTEFRAVAYASESHPLESRFRALRMLRSLENMASRPDAMRHFSGPGVNRTIPPLSDDQIEQIDQIRAGFESARSALFARHLPSIAEQAEPLFITLSLPQGRVSIRRRVEATTDGSVVSIFNGIPITAEFSTAMAELDQETVDSLRRILSIEHRQMFAAY